MFRDDYLIRLIKQLAVFIARIAGKRKAGEYQAALAESGKAWDDLIGQPPRELVDLVDTATLAGLLKEPAKMRAAAQLLIEEGKTYAASGDPAHATVRYRRAFELYLEARVLEPSDDDTAVISELARLVPANQLDERYRQDS
jgi:hypothetical protein